MDTMNLLESFQKVKMNIFLLSCRILKMMSTGLMTKWHSEWTPRPADCSNFEFVPVEASVVVTAFLLLSSGAALSFVCLAWERKKAREKTTSAHT